MVEAVSTLIVHGVQHPEKIEPSPTGVATSDDAATAFRNIDDGPTLVIQFDSKCRELSTAILRMCTDLLQSSHTTNFGRFRKVVQRDRLRHFFVNRFEESTGYPVEQIHAFDPGIQCRQLVNGASQEQPVFDLRQHDARV